MGENRKSAGGSPDGGLGGSRARRAGVCRLRSGGRGAAESFCILLGDVGPEAAERLQVIVDHEDGFAVARADLALRGMGDLFGERQSGVPTFRIADPLRDETLSDRAREAAERLLADDPMLAQPSHRRLGEVLRRNYGRALELFRVG